MSSASRGVALGFEDGDTIQSINGIDTRRLSQLEELFGDKRITDADKVVIVATQRGTPYTYEFRPLR